MKASLKLREEQNPLFKAKVPLNILGIPFQSSLSISQPKHLSLNLSTFFNSGPSFRLSYHPNDAFNPFSILLKSGVSHFGSPVDSPLTITAQFDYLNSNTTSFSPRFFIHFKPRFGDFTVKKTTKSVVGLNDVVFEDGSVEFVEKPRGCGDGSKIITNLPLKECFESAVNGMELGAKTSLPILNGAVLNLRWGIQIPQGFQSFFNNNSSNPTVKVSPRGIPLLVLNKIGIEHVAKEDKKKVDVGPQESESGAELAERCFSVKREIETLRFENGKLGKALDDLRVEFGNKREKKLMEVGDCEEEGSKV